MLAVVRTPRIKVSVKGRIPARFLRYLRKEFGKKLKIEDDTRADKIDFFETDIYKNIKQEMTPGTYVKIYRENHGLTQKALGEEVGASKSFICDVEHDRRSISKEMAKKFSKIFNITVERFL